jgi:hypothetical protein
MDSATATLDSSGSMEPADPVDKTKASTVSPASAISALQLMLVETAWLPTSNPPATKTKDMTQPSRPAFAFLELSTSEENVSASRPAPPTPTITVSPASATQASNLSMDNA